jgi:ribonuclease P protein component
MLPAKYRLAKRKDIERVMKRGRSFFVGDISIRVVKNNLENSRLNVVTSLKVSKKAVARNKLKRQIREIIRKNILKDVKPGFDGLISTKKGLLELSSDEMIKLIETLFKKSRLI